MKVGEHITWSLHEKQFLVKIYMTSGVTIDAHKFYSNLGCLFFSAPVNWKEFYSVRRHDVVFKCNAF